MFMGGSWAASFAPGFYETIIKGSALGALILPPLYLHFDNEGRYFYALTKQD